MKKILISLLVISLLLTSVFILTGCDKKEEVPYEEPIIEKNSVQETGEKEDLDFPIHPDDNAEIVGDWKTSLADYDYIYTFNSDGTGNYNAAGTDMKFTYKLSGDKISILYDGDTVSFDTTYSVDGDTLNVVDSFGEDTLYERVK